MVGLIERTLETPRGPAGWPVRREWVRLYARSTRRTVRRYGAAPRRIFARLDTRPIFIVGSNRSGTSFVAESIGALPGFSELGELAPLKRVIPLLYDRPAAEAGAQVRTIVGRAQRLGQVAGLRPVETTQETTFLIPAIALAYPDARFIHLLRDGRDVAASLLGLGWLRSESPPGMDEVGQKHGDHARFWVEPGRESEFGAASEATRAAWVWRRYDTAAEKALAEHPGRGLLVRYEELLRDPRGVAAEITRFIGADGHAERLGEIIAATADPRPSGRWRAELSGRQLADVIAEAGERLSYRGYDPRERA